MTTFHFDEQGFGTEKRRIRWDELVAVGIRTTADGPYLEDMFWLFLLRDGALELPASLVDSAALEAMQTHLSGMESLKIILAVGSTTERMFRVWHFEESRWQWDDAAFRARFAALVGRLGGQSSGADDVFERLRAAWAAEGRRYHNLEHLTECLRERDRTRGDAGEADIAELALWYHDAIYEPRAQDCEERSATRLCEDARSLQIPAERALAAAACVRATAHRGARGDTPGGPAAADLVVDIDLSILGRDPLRFMEYEYGVEEEYAQVRPTKYFLGRGRFLADLLASPSIFRTDAFRERFEARARANIAALLGSPRYWAHRWLGRVSRLVCR